jgi:hydroxypyruvate isomerase
LAGPASTPENADALLSNLQSAVAAAPAWMQLLIGPEAVQGSALPDLAACTALLDEIDARVLSLQMPFVLNEAGMAQSLAALKRYRGRLAALVMDRVPDETSSVTMAEFADALNAAGFKGWVIAAYRSDIRTDDTLGWMSSA